MELSRRKLSNIFSDKAFSFFSHRIQSYVVAYNEHLSITEIISNVIHEVGHIYYGHISPSNAVTMSLTKQEFVANNFVTFIFSKNGGKNMQTLTGNEHFTYEDMPTGKLLYDFWSWNSSDLLNNTLRGALAEFIVASAIKLDTKICREDWTAYDLESNSGRKIEVKCSAYLQSWNKDRLSKIQFSISPSRSWEAETGYSEDIKRWSDLYVFCLYSSKNRSLSPLQLEQWEFYVLPTHILNTHHETQKSITLNSLLALKPKKATYENLNSVIEEINLSTI